MLKFAQWTMALITLALESILKYIISLPIVMIVIALAAFFYPAIKHWGFNLLNKWWKYSTNTEFYIAKKVYKAYC